MRPFLVLLALAALAIPAGADGCVPSTSTTGPDQTVVEVDEPNVFGDGGVLYIAIDNCVPDACLFSVWTYAETNGIPGLQRGDEVRDDTCGGVISPDRSPLGDL